MRKRPQPASSRFAEIAAEHLDDVHRYALYLTRDGAVAEDVTAEVFARAFTQRHRFEPTRASVRAWLCAMARSIALDRFRSDQRRSRRETAYVAQGERAGDDLPFDGFSPPLARALAAMSAADREVIALRVVLDMDGPSSARVLGISASACATRLARALQRLEKEMSANVHA